MLQCIYRHYNNIWHIDILHLSTSFNKSWESRCSVITPFLLCSLHPGGFFFFFWKLTLKPSYFYLLIHIFLHLYIQEAKRNNIFPCILGQCSEKTVTIPTQLVVLLVTVRNKVGYRGLDNIEILIWYHKRILLGVRYTMY